MKGLEENQEIQEKSDEKEHLRLRRRNHNLGPHPRNNVLHVPGEIMLNIISRLPVELVLKCRLVCKTWRNLPILRDNHFADMQLRCHHQKHLDHHNHSNSAATNKMSFGFLGLGRLHCFHRLHRSIHYVEFDRNIDESSVLKPVVRRINHPLPLEIGPMVGASNGLICLSILYNKGNSVFEDPIYICNPITQEYVYLPRCVVTERDNYKNIRLVHGFGYHPLTNEYKVVRIYYCDVRQQSVIGQVQVYTLGSGSGWRNIGEITYLIQNSYYFMGNSCLLNGTLHWLADGNKIVAFDLADEEFHLLPTPPFSSPNWCKYSKLWVLEEWLCLVHQKSGFNADIWLRKKNEFKETWSWSKEFSFGVGLRSKKLEYQPLAIKRDGSLLFYHNKAIVRYNPKTLISKVVVNLDNDVFSNVIVAHFHSFVSLEALGENSLRATSEHAKSRDKKHKKK